MPGRETITKHMVLDIHKMYEDTNITWNPPWDLKVFCQGETYNITLKASNRLTNYWNYPNPSVSLVFDPCNQG